MTLIVIAAVAQNRTIGLKGGLPWSLPEDLKRFRALTRGYPVIMGRKTFESIGKPLPDRLNLVVTSQADWFHAGVTRVANVEQAIRLAERSGAPRAFAIGGERIYAEALPFADRLELTEIQAQVDGDAFFPQWDRSAFDEIERLPRQENGLRYAFVTYVRGNSESAD